jgi:hypothetical protein
LQELDGECPPRRLERDETRDLPRRGGDRVERSEGKEILRNEAHIEIRRHEEGRGSSRQDRDRWMFSDRLETRIQRGDAQGIPTHVDLSGVRLELPRLERQIPDTAVITGS